MTELEFWKNYARTLELRLDVSDSCSLVLNPPCTNQWIPQQKSHKIQEQPSSEESCENRSCSRLQRFLQYFGL